jgi:ketosteroid isomerase-like protein
MRKRSLKAPTKSGKIPRSKIRSAVTGLHVVPRPAGTGWIVKRSGDGRFVRTFQTKEKAVAFGQSMAREKRTGLIIHARDGKIQQNDSYNDSKAPQERSKH